MARGCRKIDMIGARAPYRYETESWAPGKHTFRELDGRSNVEHQLGAGDALDQTVFRSWQRVVVLDFGSFGEARPCSARAKDRGCIVGNIDLRHWGELHGCGMENHS